MAASFRFAPILLFSAPLTFLGIVLGGYWVWSGPIVIMAVLLLGDLLWRNDLPVPESPRTWAFDLVLFSQVPLSCVALFLLAWCAAPGDLGGLGALLQRWTDWPLLQRHSELSTLNKLGAAWSTGFLLSTNTVVAHEFVHRPRSLASMIAGRWLLAMVGDAQFSISHVQVHHRWVGTRRDSATARRGEVLYAFVVRSVLGQLRSSREIEANRLRQSGRAFWSPDNRFVTGLAMTLVVVALFFLAAGWMGVGLFLVCATYSKFLFEAVNYIQHYGLVRSEGAPIESRHSWDCVNLFSSCFLFNLPRHAHHHLRAGDPFWELRPGPGALTLETGYMAAILLAMVPPVWIRAMARALRYWDEKLATREERELIRAQGVTR
ncbi:MAG: alkane 1-monooxygenase [Betaproteobacteria bacterium]|nr:MAG: alkane 1-monooxygenase [Betaproteobacteria bacterium]